MASFETIKEEAVTVGGKEFRITVTLIADKGEYLVGIREYTRSERYTGYSKFNGVSVPAADLESAHTLARTFFTSMQMMASVHVEVQNQSAGKPLTGAEYNYMHQAFHGGTPNMGIPQDFNQEPIAQTGHMHHGLQTFHGTPTPQNFGSEGTPPPTFGGQPTPQNFGSEPKNPEEDDLPF